MIGSLEAAAGQTIRFEVSLPRGNGPFPVVVVVHGFKGFRNWGFFPEIAARCARAGIAAIRVDLSHNGIDAQDGLEFSALDRFQENRPSYEVFDLNCLLDGLRARRVFPELPLRRERFALLGHSRGGAAAILTAAVRRDVVAITTWASVSSLAYPEAAYTSVETLGYWEVLNGRTGQLMRVGREAIEESRAADPVLDLAAATARVADSLLLIHGQEDQSVPLSAAFELRALAGQRGWLHEVPAADHVMNCRHPFTGPTPAFEDAMAASLKQMMALL